MATIWPLLNGSRLGLWPGQTNPSATEPYSGLIRV
jgi:hypothetical protein